MPAFSESTGGETSPSLLQRARGRDADAWSRLVQLYSPLIFSWARSGGLGEADAADIVQDVWQAVDGALARFDHDRQAATFRGWLWTITRNKLTSHFRNQSGKAVAAGGSEARQMVESIPEAEPVDESGVQDHQLLHRALEAIRPEFEKRTWDAFWRMTVDGRTAVEVGAELGLAANAVHQAKFRVLRRLRQEMAGLVEA